MDFNSRYAKLNDAQKSAVDAIDGPIMVIAGPGTGKTELLSMRAANILKKTDVLPENILCLTFTDAGSIAMQKRLTSIIGREAYNVSIHTFHAFGSEIMNRYREYFYNGADFQLADDLARHRIITEILDSLEYNNPLRSQMNGTYTAMNDIMAAISDLKRAGLTDEEFRQLLDITQATAEIAGKNLGKVFSQRISKGTRDALADTLTAIEAIEEDTPIPSMIRLRDVLARSIHHAVEDADNHEKVTPPITAWKNEWMTTDVDGAKVLKIQKALPKLRALNHIYSLYLQTMLKEEMIDYDDMIMQVVHAIEVHDDLRYDLHEKYQYIMVDEFQDTNMAQMRILHNLINNPVVQDTPNLLVVGDDDQAIYGFQGAEINNILGLKELLPKTALITLTDNYRSNQPVLDGAREVITQGENRLETRIPELDKTLASHVSHQTPTTEIVNFTSPHDERKWITKSIDDLINKGTKPSEIAVIARKHKDLISLLSYMANKNIPISYDRRDNVLEDDVIKQLVLVGNIVHDLSVGRHNEANIHLSELISHPAWGIDPATIWEISLNAYKNRLQWLEVMQEHAATKELFAWLVATAKASQHLPLERIIDILVGHTAPDGAKASPLKEYYFSDKKMHDDSANYVVHLENLSAIRQRLRDHVTGTMSPKLVHFLEFIEENQQAGIQITSLRHVGEDNNAVQLLSAHGSKGLEFNHVFIVNATDKMWGEKASGRSSVISFPPHLRLRQNNSDYDERLRLFYVAMTRAKYGLHISYANENDTAKEMLQASFLLNSSFPHDQINESSTDATTKEAAEQMWYAPIVNIPSATMKEHLAPILEHYKLSATHVNSFIDVTNGGPQQFLLNTLLRFPSASSAAANYGTAIHRALQRAHEHLRATGSQQPEEDILHEFEKQLDQLTFSDDERRRYLQQGCDALRTFLHERYAGFSNKQLPELDFARQDVVINDVHLTGKLDVAEIDDASHSIRVIDYKTGSALTDWNKGDAYKKMKAHKYRQQLLFYKLLIEHSRDWRKYTMNEGVLQFVEPDQSNQIIDLRLADIDATELDRFTRLIDIVWRHIQDLSFPDTSTYENTIEGIQQFEEDLLAEKI